MKNSEGARMDSIKRNRYARELHRFLRRVSAHLEDRSATWESFLQACEQAFKKLQQTEAVPLYSPYNTELIRLAEALRSQMDGVREREVSEVAAWLAKEMNRLEKMRRVGSYQRAGTKRYEDEEWE